jgi:hypothetical protein
MLFLLVSPPHLPLEQPRLIALRRTTIRDEPQGEFILKHRKSQTYFGDPSGCDSFPMIYNSAIGVYFSDLFEPESAQYGSGYTQSGHYVASTSD